MGTKICEQCHAEKNIDLFYMVTNQYTGLHPMSLCKDCYKGNLEAQKRKSRTEWEAGAERRERAREQTLQVQKARDEQEREREQRDQEYRERQERQQELQEAWYRQQPGRQCIDCKQVLAASAFGYSSSSMSEGFWLPDPLHKRCKPCHKTYREGNKQVRPLCLMCQAPTQRHDFLQEYNGYRLDIIKVCCKQCIPQFEALPEAKQLELFHQAMIKAYGKTSVVYALQYDDQFPCQHIGRTKDYVSRMAQYKRGWYREIKRHFILQQLFGPLSMEYESRWMLHALKHRWPIDNFELLKFGTDGLSGTRQQSTLTEAVQSFEPLTVPFEVVEELIYNDFIGTTDAEIVHWYCSHYHPHVYPSENEMVQRIALMKHLHSLTIP